MKVKFLSFNSVALEVQDSDEEFTASGVLALNKEIEIEEGDEIVLGFSGDNFVVDSIKTHETDEHAMTAAYLRTG
jgi:hypothetical protein